MSEQISMISWEEFENLPVEEQKQVINELKDALGATKLIDFWGISRSKFYSTFNKLNKSKEKGTSELNNSRLSSINPDKLYMIISTDFEGAEISTKLALLNSLIQEDKAYRIKIEIQEK